MQMLQTPLGVMGRGSNSFRCGILHSGGDIYLGTYGPQPAIIWRYRMKTGYLEEVARPGEYQLDSMLEAPNGKIYIGTAYNALIYELDPDTHAVRNLGTPLVASTPWIFTMILTRMGDIIGAKGAGLFKLDWRTGSIQGLGLIPGEHMTLGLNASLPIIRSLQERADGKIWGATNRQIFLFDPEDDGIKLALDVCTLDPACYGIMLPSGLAPCNDLFFFIMTRYSGQSIRHPINRLDAITGIVTSLESITFTGEESLLNWREEFGRHTLVLSCHQEIGSETFLLDPFSQTVVDVWKDDTQELKMSNISGNGSEYFYSIGRGALYHHDADNSVLKRLINNPVPAQCRCLAISQDGLLVTDTYDCAHVFTSADEGKTFVDHGRMSYDDHRANYGPAVITPDDRFFVCNHGEQVTALWVSDLQTNAHRRVGKNALDLVVLGNGTIAGRFGETPAAYRYDPARCYTDSWREKEGELFTLPTPYEKTRSLGIVCGAIAPMHERDDGLYVAQRNSLVAVSFPDLIEIASCDFAYPIVRLAVSHSGIVYVLTDENALHAATFSHGQLSAQPCYCHFPERARGFFTMPISGALVGLSDKACCVYDGVRLYNIETTAPFPPAGPAVSQSRDVFYFAHDSLTRYDICL